MSPDILADSLKRRIRSFWNAQPCGTKFARATVGTAEFFQEIEQHRYRTEWHIPEIVKFPAWRGHDVLEVGCGLGTEGVNFARAGARYVGIDLSEVSVEWTRKRFALEGLRGAFRVADAEALPFEDAAFDLVYSHGVLHHTADIAKAVDEAYRVLKPRGTAIVMVYHRNSYNYHVNIMLLRRFGARLLRFDWGPALIHKMTGEDVTRLLNLQTRYCADRRAFLARDEFLSRNTDGAENPLSRVFSKSDAQRLFNRFRSVRTEVHFLNRRWLPLVGPHMPRKVEDMVAGRFGWHLWVLAQK